MLRGAMEALAGGLLGIVLGMRHALDADHLAAVSTLIAQHRSVRKGASLGLLWGFGHALTLFAVGVILILARREIPPRLGEVFELAVAVMLVVLGARALLGRGHDHDPRRMAARPLGIGMVHGLAGSGALTALVVLKLPTVRAQLLYLVLFGLGSVIGMAVVSGLATWPLARVNRRTIQLAAGSLAACLGVTWAWPILTHWLR
jgi:High-affinity nickel-transport protein